MKAPGPGRKVLLADDHPHTIDVSEEPDRPKLFFMSGANLGHECNDVLSQGVVPNRLGMKLQHPSKGRVRLQVHEGAIRRFR